MATILVVDDEKSIRLTVSRALESAGHQVEVAVDGTAALEKLEAITPDAMLLDLQMPGMDGISVLEKAVERHPQLKTAIVSAHGTVDNAVSAMKLGAVDFLQKPFTAQELRGLVERMLRIPETAESTGTLDYDAQVEAARRLARERRFDEATQQVKTAIGQHPDRPEGFNLLGELLEVQGNHNEAVTNYRAAVNLDPTFDPAKKNLDRATTDLKSRPTL